MFFGNSSSSMLHVSIVDQKQELFRNIVRLRRVARTVPGNEDISAVRVALERELGATVSQRLAARLLGVSHTALARWIKNGDLPLVFSSGGRSEIPVAALLDLYETVEQTREQGPQRYVLTPTMTRQRDAAARLRVGEVSTGGVDHGRATARNLAYHQVVARRLRKPMVEEARHVLFRWREHGQIDSRYADRWKDVFALPVSEIRKVLVAEGQEFDDLRQTSPFAGVLSEPDRRRIMQRVN